MNVTKSLEPVRRIAGVKALHSGDLSRLVAPYNDELVNGMAVESWSGAQAK